MKKITALVLVMMLAVSAVAFADALKVGTNPEFPPFEFVDDSGAIAGLDVDIMNAIGAKVGFEVQMESMEFDALIPALASGKIDVAIAGMTNTEERRQSVLFTDPYYNATQVILVKAEGATVAGEADLDGKKIGVQMGTTGDLYCTEQFPAAEVNRFSKGIDAVQDLVNGRLDAVVIDDAPAHVFATEAPGLVVLDDKMSEEVYSIALPFGSEDLCAKMNAALTEMAADGSLQAIIDKY